MSISQISVFLESKPGHVSRALDAFVGANINVRGYSAADTGDYGVVRFIVDTPEKALDVLRDMGFAALTTDVVCVRLDDIPGELARIMRVLASRDINVVYSYSLISTYIALSVDDLAAAEAALRAEGVELLCQADLAGSADGSLQ